MAAELPFLDPFDEGVFGYVPTVSGVSVEFSALDVEGGAASSGSARVVNARTEPLSGGPVNWVLDCFAVEAGTPYTAAAWILIPDGETATGQATVMISWYASASCSQLSFLSLGRTFEIRDPGSWQRTEEPLTAPPGASGARIGMGVFKTEATGSLAAHFDELLLAPEPTGAGTGVAALLALGALRSSSRCARRLRAGNPRFLPGSMWADPEAALLPHTPRRGHGMASIARCTAWRNGFASIRRRWNRG